MKILFLFYFLLICLYSSDSSRVLGVYETCPPNFKPKIRVAACYAQYQGEFILVQLKNGMHGVPGGKIEKNETVPEGMLREYFEETKIRLVKEKLKYLRTVYISDPEKDFIFDIFEYDFSQKPEVSINEAEHQAYTWATLEDSLKFPLIWGEKEVFERYISGNSVTSILYEKSKWFERSFGFVDLTGLYTRVL